MKVVENSTQNAQNCTIFKNFLGGHASKSKEHSRHVYIKSQKLQIWAPPPEKPAYTPEQENNYNQIN